MNTEDCKPVPIEAFESEISMPQSEDCKFRIPLSLFLAMQQEDCSIDCCDTEIDNVICVERDIYNDPEFPLLEKCTRMLRDLIDVVGLNPVIVDISGLLHHNKDVCREWIKENWKPDYQGLMDTEDGEWEFQFIESFNQIISGNVGEKTHARYVQLLSQFKRVPAQSNEYVIIQQGEVVQGPQNGGIK